MTDKKIDNDYVASQEDRERLIDLIMDNDDVNYTEAVRRYEKSREAHLNFQEDYDDD